MSFESESTGARKGGQMLCFVSINHAAAPGTTDWSCARALLGGCALAAPPSPGRIQCFDRVPAKAGKSADQSGKPLGRARRAGFVIRCVA
jgi:hypothetical protein